MKVICVANNKGGVGKTTTAVNLGIGLAKKGKRVLLLELDGQGNLGQSLGCRTENKPTVYDLLALGNDCRRWSDEEGIQRKSGIDIVPADRRLTLAENLLSLRKFGRETVVKKVIEQLTTHRKYDYIILDTEPHLGLLTVNALISSDEVVIPIKPEELCFEGAKATLEMIAEIKENINPRLKVRGLLVTMLDGRRDTKEEIDQIEDLARVHKTKRFETKIRLAAAQVKANKHHISVFEYMPTSAVTADYKQLVDELCA